MYYIIGGDGKQYGPISNEELRHWIAEGRLNAQSMAKLEGEADFRRLSTFAEFTDLFLHTPSAPALAPTGMVDEEAARAIKVPAISLIVIASIGIVFYILNTIGILTGSSGHTEMPQNLSPQMQQFWDNFEKGQHGPLAVIISLFIVCLNGFVLFGSIKMLKLQSYGIAVAAAICAMVPCQCCCLLGLPFGIWALVVLNKPHVKSQFS